jgi:hypothetical protein
MSASAPPLSSEIYDVAVRDRVRIRATTCVDLISPSQWPSMTLTGAISVHTAADHVSFVFTVENEGSETETLSFRDACTADFAVLDGDDERWRWSQGRMFAQVLQSEELAPGESVTYEGGWGNPEGGEHTAVATLEADNQECEVRTEFSV